MLLGFAPAALAAYLPFLTLYAIMLHANVDWSFGPLRNVIASPAYHRWHHAAEAQALNKNFSGLFPFYDRLFGTHYLPRGTKAAGFGIISGEVPPRGFVGQMLYPFKLASAARSPPPTNAPASRNKASRSHDRPASFQTCDRAICH